MNFRLVATEPRYSTTGTPYNHMTNMAEFDGTQYDEDEAIAQARESWGATCTITVEEIPYILH